MRVALRPRASCGDRRCCCRNAPGTGRFSGWAHNIGFSWLLQALCFGVCFLRIWGTFFGSRRDDGDVQKMELGATSLRASHFFLFSWAPHISDVCDVNVPACENVWRRPPGAGVQGALGHAVPGAEARERAPETELVLGRPQHQHAQEVNVSCKQSSGRSTLSLPLLYARETKVADDPRWLRRRR